MKKLVLGIILIFLAAVSIGSVTYLDTEGIGVRVFPQVIDDAPAEPFDCLVDQRGKELYVDDTNDGAEAYLCFCGTTANDVLYEWVKIEDPNTVCFP